MLTYEKVLEVFREYLSEDKDCEVVNTSRGYTVMVWDNRRETWYSSEIAPTPEALRDILLDSYCDYLAYKMTDGYEREDLTEQETQGIEAMRRALLESCETL